MLETIKTKLEIRHHRQNRLTSLSSITHESKNKIAQHIEDFEKNIPVVEYMQKQLQKHTDYEVSKYDFSYTRKGGSTFFPLTTLYSIIRTQKPDIIVETGGTPGKSSVGILKAIDENNKGILYTCDLPPNKTTAPYESNKIHSLRPDNIPNNWIIPKELQNRQELILGDTKETLKPLLQKLGEVDIFIHDSLHTYEHMMFEFEAAWKHIKTGGLLLSDDVYTHSSFQDFASKIKMEPFYVGNYGIIKKQ